MVVIFDRRNGVGIGGPQGTFLWNKIRKLLDNVAGV